MVSLETGDLRQYAVLWSMSSYDDNGRPVLGVAAEIMVRAESYLSEVLTNGSTPVVADIILAVDQDIAIGSQVRLGQLVDVPATPNELLEVIDFTKVPDLKARHFRRTVALIKKSN